MTGCMAAPVIVPRAEHPISRKDIDPDAVKVLYRLREFNYTAYLVGGSVRDLLLGRQPKDFDIGTDAHPYQIKKLFRNCWIIGRRFRLAHVRFGTKTIEVATFRRHVAADEVLEAPPTRPSERRREHRSPRWRPRAADADGDGMVRHDNTFGTPEEDAFRRDFTINALFYDIGTFSIIDYVGGLEDLRGRRDSLHRRSPASASRKTRSACCAPSSFAARLDFTLDPPIVDAIAQQRHLMALGLAGPADRGVLQDPALRRGRADVPRAGGARPAGAGHPGTAARARTNRCGTALARARRLSAAVRPRCRHSSPTRSCSGSLLLPARTDAARHGRRRARGCPGRSRGGRGGGCGARE